VVTQGAFNLLFRPGLRADFRDSFDDYEPEYSNFLKVETSNMPEQAASIITGLSRLLERGDGEAITYEDPVMGPKVMGVDKEFALGFMITRRTVEDDQYGKANQASKWLAHAARMTYEYRAAALLDDAFTGTTFKGIDSLPLLSTAHTLIGNTSTTVANRPATDVGMSITGVTAVQDLFQLMKDENGDPVQMWPDTLVVGNNAGDINRAWQIFNSVKEPFTANNQDNAIKHRMGNMKIFVSHFKQSSKSYFFFDSKRNDARMVIRRPVEFDDDFDFNTDAALYKTTTRFLIWFVDWKGWAGVNPT
jgi:hypothetical protein